MRYELHVVPVCAAGVGVHGVQGGDPGDDGGRVSPDEAAGDSRPAGERLQTDLHQQTRAALLVRNCTRSPQSPAAVTSLSLKLRAGVSITLMHHMQITAYTLIFRYGFHMWVF